ncbi:MAG TPA: hypothetical protein VE128_00650 [Candidatus Angelobacter sp.]|jgi:hypothetical protein|nr:hypothetical protein [Candidatus Angelobacter sp.]
MERFLYLHFLIKNYPVNQIRDKVHQLYKKFLVKIQKIRKEKLEKFFLVSLNKKFYHFFLEKEKTKTFQEVNKKLNVLSKIIEDLKNLYIFPDNDKMVINFLKKIKEIKDSWENSRNIFYSKVEYVFKTYRFHLENFFNYLKFNKNFQSLEYEHNIQKLHMISRVKELIKETKLPKNLNELYHLHHLRKKPCRKTNYLLKYKNIIEKINHLKDKNAFFFKFFYFKNKIFKESIKSFYHKKLFYKKPKNIQYIKRKLQAKIQDLESYNEYYRNFLYEKSEKIVKFQDNSNYFFNKRLEIDILKKFNDFSIYTEFSIDTFLMELASLRFKKLYYKFLFDKYDFLEKKLFKYMEIISNEILKTRKKILTIFWDKKAFFKNKSLDHKKEILNCFMTKYNYIIYIIEFLEILEKII